MRPEDQLTKPSIDSIQTMPTKLRPFQAKGVRKIHHFNGRALLFDEMGLGKTVQALFYAKEVPAARPVIVICPALHKWNWEKMAREHVGFRAQVLESKKPLRRIPLNLAPLLIINYDILQYWLPWLKSLHPKLVVVDEGRNIKNRSAKRTKATKSLCRKAKRVIILDGSGSMDNRPEEIFTSLNIVRPDLFPSFWQFATRYCGPKRRPWGWEFKGATNIPELHELLNKTCMIRRLKEEVVKDLPPKVRQVIPVDIVRRGEYKELEDDFRSWARRKLKSSRKIKKIMRAEALTKIGYLKRTASTLKFKSVCDWIDSFLEENPNRKLIVFGIHKKLMLHPLREKYKKICVEIDGETSRERRKEYFHRFATSKKCRLLFGQLNATGVAWSAKKCNNVLFAELGWTPAEHEQAEDRIHGLYRGIEGERSFIYYLVAKGTIEERICELIQEKKRVLSAILDGRGEVEDFDIYNRLVREYASGKKAA